MPALARSLCQLCQSWAYAVAKTTVAYEISKLVSRNHFIQSSIIFFFNYNHSSQWLSNFSTLIAILSLSKVYEFKNQSKSFCHFMYRFIVNLNNFHSKNKRCFEFLLKVTCRLLVSCNSEPLITIIIIPTRKPNSLPLI